MKEGQVVNVLAERPWARGAAEIPQGPFFD